MKQLLILLLLFSATPLFSQKVLKENLGPKVRVYWDANNKHLQAVGSYFTSEATPKTTEKHGKWTFYSYDGILEEESNYYRDRLLGKRVFYYTNKQIKEESYFKFNVPDSLFFQWNPNGKLITKGQFELGSSVGEWHYYFDDGREKSIEKVVNDTVYLMANWEADSSHRKTISDGNGMIEERYINGVVKNHYTFENGLKNGPFEERTANGVLSVGGAFKNGKKDNTWEFYNFEGILEKRISYKADSLDGAYLVVALNGDTITSGAYQMGEKEGFWIWKTPEQKIEMSGYFHQDLQDSIWHYYFSSGELSYIAHFKDGLRTGEWNYYYLNGASYRKGDYSNDVREGKWQTWYEDGVLLMDGQYHQGKEEGVWYNYWENGALKNKVDFKAGLMHGTWFSYTPESVLTSTGKYKKGYKVGTWYSYYNNGRLKEKANYKIFTQTNVTNDMAIMGLKETVSDFHGKFEAFSQKDFQLKSSGHYYKGLKHGKWIDYYPGGVVPTIISEYKYGKLDGVFEQLDPRGRPVYEIHYKHGLKHGPFIVYGENGQIVSQKEFRYGKQVSSDGNGSLFTP
ncbi:MAG: toxin-antitoxin system YwqK family antitoxin [Flavobacteriales bacterium]